LVLTSLGKSLTGSSKDLQIDHAQQLKEP
jgi:hypothetical protein